MNASKPWDLFGTDRGTPSAAGPPPCDDKYKLISWLWQVAYGPSRVPPTARALAQQMPLRVHETLKCFLAGKTEKETARMLGLSAHTVHHYAKTIYAHFCVSSRGELLSRCLAGPADEGH
jgi:DNA-binding CsgD family transcriptional regulator